MLFKIYKQTLRVLRNRELRKFTEKLARAKAEAVRKHVAAIEREVIELLTKALAVRGVRTIFSGGIVGGIGPIYPLPHETEVKGVGPMPESVVLDGENRYFGGELAVQILRQVKSIEETREQLCQSAREQIREEIRTQYDSEYFLDKIVARLKAKQL